MGIIVYSIAPLFICRGHPAAVGHALTPDNALATNAMFAGGGWEPMLLSAIAFRLRHADRTSSEAISMEERREACKVALKLTIRR